MADTTLMTNVEDWRITIELQPGLLNAFQEELGSIFKTAKIIQRPQDAGEADLLAFPAFSFRSMLVKLAMRFM